MTAIEAALFALLGVLAATAAWLDIRNRLIPHWLCALVLAGGVVSGLVLAGPAGAGTALLHALLALAGGFVLFAAGMIGGGDAKYYAAVAAWFPLRDWLFLLVGVTTSGIVLLIAWFIWRRVTGRPVLAGGTTEDTFGKMPYGVAISLGAILSLATAWLGR